MNAKHTPGPWVVYDADGSIGSVETVDGKAVAYAQIVGTLGRQNEESKDIRRANARLIAKSPELADLLREYALPFEDADKARAEYGIATVERELRRRALLAEAIGKEDA